MTQTILRFVTVAVAVALSFAHAASTASSKGDGSSLLGFLAEANKAIADSMAAGNPIFPIIIAAVTVVAFLILLIPIIIEQCKSSSEKTLDAQTQSDFCEGYTQSIKPKEFAASTEATSTERLSKKPRPSMKKSTAESKMNH